MRALVTGITGFAGGHLAEALLARGDEVAGLSRSGEWPADLRFLAGRVALYACDLRDASALEALLRRVEPERIYHLAGYTNAGRSFAESDAAWEGNLGATRNLYRAVEAWGGRPRILFVGSGLVYETPAEPDHIHTEACPLAPASPYAASKSASDLLSYQVAAAGMDVVRVRPFNHTGPRQSPEFAIAHFAKQIAAAERGAREPVLETGNLTPRRDLTDVRDVVRSYLLLLELGRRGEVYNVASGVAPAVGNVLERLLAFAKVRIEVRRRADLVRAVDVPVVCGDAGKLRRETGWQPSIPLERTLADTLEYWRNAS